MNTWILWILAGMLSLAGGLLALANPFAATLAAEMLVGYTFILVGVLTIFSAFSDMRWGARLLALLMGVAILFFGINLVGHPLRGIVQLTVIVAFLLFVTGVFRLLIAFSPDAASIRVPLTLSGLLSIALGGVILSDMPGAAVWALGTLLAIDLLSNGVSLIAIGLDRRKRVAV